MNLSMYMLTMNVKWDLGNFLENSAKTLNNWIGLATIIIGIVCMGVAIWQLTTGLMSQGKKPTNWAVTFMLLLVGGVLGVKGGFDFFKGIAGGGKQTIEDLGIGKTGVIMMFDYLKYML